MLDAKKLAASYQLPPAVARDIVAQGMQQSLRRHWQCWTVLVVGMIMAATCWTQSHAAGLWLGMIFGQAWWMLGMHYADQPIHAAAREKVISAGRSVDALARLMPRG